MTKAQQKIQDEQQLALEAQKLAEAKEAEANKTRWLNEDLTLKLVKQAKSKGLDLDQAFEFIASEGYSVGGKQVFMSMFASIWYNNDAEIAISNFF